MNQQKKLTPIKSIRAKCLDCSNGSAHEVKLCPIARCPLYPYRLGKNPNYKPKDLTEEQREELRQRGRELMARQEAAKIAHGSEIGEN